MLKLLLVLFTALEYALTLLPWALLLRLADAPKKARQRQVPLLGTTLFWCLLWLTDLRVFQNYCTQLLNLLRSSLPALPLLQTDFAIILLCNACFFASLTLAKFLCSIVIRILCSLFEGTDRVFAASLYIPSSHYGEWFLRNQFIGARRIAHNVYAATVAVGMIVFVLAGFGASGFGTVFYPCMGVAVASEVYSLLGGETQGSNRDSVEEDLSTVHQMSMYGKILKSLRFYLPDRLLHNTSSKAKLQEMEASRDFCERLIQSPRYHECLAGRYYDALLKQGVLGPASPISRGELSYSAVTSSVQLLEGASVLFSTPFFLDYLPYLFLPISTHLVRNRHVVFLYGPGGDDRQIREYVEDGIRLVTNVEGLWTVGSIGDSTFEPDVALISSKDFADLSLLQSSASYFKSTGLVVLIDPSGLLAANQISFSILSELLAEGAAVTYCAFDRNCMGLVDTLSHALRTSIVEVTATELARGISIGAFWDADADAAKQELFPDIVRDIDMAPLVGLVALKSQVPQVSWVGRDSVPLLDQRWVLSQYYAELLSFAELPQEQNEIDSHIEFFSDPWSVGRRQDCFLMVEDEYHNLFECYRQYASRGTKQSFVNIVAPNYLLRDYMVDNARVFEHDLKAIPAISLDYPNSARNAIVSLLVRMLEGVSELTEEDVVCKLAHIGVSSTNPQQVLRELLDAYLFDERSRLQGRPSDYLVVHQDRRYNDRLDMMCERRTYSMGDRVRLLECVERLLSVPILTELPDGNRMVFARRPLGLIWQTMLPGQFLTLEGKYYEVLSINSGVGVVVRRASEQYRAGRSYRQLRTYRLAESATRFSWEHISSRTINGVVCSMRPLDIWVHTEGYLELRGYQDIRHARRISVSDIPDRHMVHKDVLMLEFTGASPAVQRTLAVLISEMLVTLFPKEHDYLAVLTPKADALPDGILSRLVVDGVGESTDVLYIVEDASIDLGALSAVERHLDRILEMVADYLAWLTEGRARQIQKPLPSKEYGDEAGEEGPKADADDVAATESDFTDWDDGLSSDAFDD